jgi:SAM-dependent methyltransferase
MERSGNQLRSARCMCNSRRVGGVQNQLEVNEETETKINGVYAGLYEQSVAGSAGDKFQRMSDRYRNGHWKKTVRKLGLFSKPLNGGTFVDFGCKFGHLTPLLMESGVAHVISVDVDEEYLSDGDKFIGKLFGSRYVKSDDCYLDIPSNSVDFILANEVISHINPSLLDIFYSECARILKVGGELVISDGNNFSHYPTRCDLIDWYCAWDHGTSKEFANNYEKQRFAMLRRALKARRIPEEKLQYYARNTSGLFGDRLIETVRRAEDEGIFTERPHRPGVPPIHPVYGVAMERAFYPLQVEMSLRTYGLGTEQMIGIGSPRLIRSEEERGKTKNFVIRATKLPENREALKEIARQDTPQWD